MIQIYAATNKMPKRSNHFQTAENGQDNAFEDNNNALCQVKVSFMESHCKKRRFSCSPVCFSSLKFLFIVSTILISILMQCVPKVLGRCDKREVLLQPYPDRDRSTAFREAAVAAGQLECSIVGKDIMKAGGNAVDAAIATTLCQGVVEPYFSGIGGGSAITIYNATTKSVTCITSREKAPAVATKDMYINATETKKGARFIAVPGELKGLEYAYKKYGGKLKWADLFEPAIRKARFGFKVSGSMEPKLQDLYDTFISSNLNSYFCELYCNKDKTGVKKEGDLVNNPRLADTLTKIQKYGVDEFYKGEIAQMMIKDLAAVGGIITEKDLLDYSVEEHLAIQIPLPNAGYTIHAPPLPYGGAVFGGILSIIDLFNITPSEYKQNPIVQWHRLDEAFKHAYGARAKMGDSDDVPGSMEIVNQIVTGEFAAAAKKKIDDFKTFHDLKYYGATYLNAGKSSTSQISILAPNKDAVSMTSTINYIFGSDVISPSTGIIFNNEMDDFSYPTGDPIHDSLISPANQIEGGKRPLSSMSPVVFTDNVENDPVFTIGAAGGIKIPASIANVMLRFLYFGDQDFDNAVCEKRIHDSLVPDVLNYEEGFDQEIIEGLEKIGHNVAPMEVIGHINGISYRKNHIRAYSDLRNKGAGVSGW